MLEAPEAIHTAARRYCSERAADWRQVYQSRIDEVGGDSRNVPTAEAVPIYSRYQILEATQIEIERTTGRKFDTVEQARTCVLQAAQDALLEETRPPDLILSHKDLLKDPAKLMERMSALGPKAKVVSKGKNTDKEDRIRKQVMEAEVADFDVFISSMDETKLGEVERLAFRRTLNDEESTRLLGVMRDRWGVDGEWYPLDRAADAEPPAQAVAFQSKPFFTKDLVTLLWKILSRVEIERVYEIREGSAADREIEVELLKPWYDFNEGFWLDDSGEWLIYASHEGSVTVAGE